MGRRKIEIQPITHERNRSVTFLKRKNGLFKKAYELGVLCSVDVAVIIFEERAGHHVKLHEYCSTDVDNMVQRHLHFDGEKEFKGPPDFNNKADAGENDDEDDEDEEGGKRRVVGNSSASKMSTGMKTGSGRMLQGKQSGSMMGLDMDYRGSMALPQPPLGHLQIPSAVSLSNASPTSYQTSSGIPVSLVRNTPNDGMPSAAKRQRLDSSASSGGYGGDNPYALHGDVQSPASYGLSSGLFPPSGQRQGGGGNPASPTTHQFFPPSMAGFPRTGSGGGNSRNSFSGGSGSYQGNQPPIYNPSNPFASLIGSANNAAPSSTTSASPHGHGHSHAHHPGSSFEPLDWPVHNPSSSGQQPSASQQQTSSDRGGPSSASPHPQSQSQQGFPPRPGQTASGGSGAQDTSWLDFLSNSAPPPGVAAGAGADTSRPGSVTSGGAGRRMEDSYERGMSGLSSSQIQRSRSDSSVKEEGGGAARAASVNSASDASRPSANGSALAGGGGGGGDTKEGLDIKSDKD